METGKGLGDRPENPEFIETLPKRGYRFVASVQDASAPETPIVPTPHGTEEQAMEEKVALATAPSEEEGSSAKHRLWKLAIIPALAVVAAAAIAGQHFLVARNRANALSVKNTSIAVLPFADMSAAKDQEYFSDGLAEQLINDLAKVSGKYTWSLAALMSAKGSTAMEVLDR